MTILLSQVLLGLALLMAPAFSHAQVPTDTLLDRREFETAPLVRPLPTGFRAGRSCEAPIPCSIEQDTGKESVSRKRGRYALTGFLLGATVGAGWYLRACASGECYSLFPAVLFGTAGGLVGTVIGLLIAPAPG